MGHLFISCCQEDRQYAWQLSEALRQHGFDVWIDDRADHGAHWLDVVSEALEASSAVIVIVSTAAANSAWITREVLLARQFEKPLVPLRLDGISLPLLEGAESAEVTNGQLPNQAFFDQLATLVPGLRRYGMALAPGPEQIKQLLNEDTADPADVPTLPRPPRRRRRVNLVALVGVLLVVGMGLVGGLVIQHSHAVAEAQLMERANNFHGDNAAWRTHSKTIAGIELVLVPAGCFTLGSTESQVAAATTDCIALGMAEATCQAAFADETPAHQQCFAEPFWIGRNPITRREYGRCVEAGTCPPARDVPDGTGAPDQPITDITFDDAQAFVNWLSTTTETFSLPAEAEWEYAARGPDGLAYSWGNDWVENAANFGDVNCPESLRDVARDYGYGTASPVEAYHATGVSWVGALDMAGNVWEWTVSPYGPYPLDPESDDPGGDRVLRGGAWNSPAYEIRAAQRRAAAPDTHVPWLGFRVVIR